MVQIYKIQNKTNGKIYIGQTKRTLEQRLNQGFHSHFNRAFNEESTKPLYVDMRKYGKDGFTYETIEERDFSSFSSKEEAISWLSERERYWIEYYKSYEKDLGYNISHGGLGPSGFSLLKGKKFTAEQRKNVSNGTLLAMQRDDVKENHAKGLQKAKESGKLSHNKGRTYVTKGDVLRFVFPDEAERLIREEGFVKGNLICGKTIKQRYQTNPEYRKNVSEGTKKGLANMTDEARNSMNQNRKNTISSKILISNGMQKKRINPEMLDAYLASGWSTV